MKIKAYLTKPNGNRWKKGVDVKIREEGASEYLLDSIFYPDRYGNVLYDVRLDDSLTLDKRYSIDISEVKEKRYHDGLSHEFKLEDYLLKEVNYSFSAAQASYRKGEKVVLLAGAKDENNQFVADAIVHLIAKVDWVETSDEEELYIPDTLWNFRQTLIPNQETQIIFPDSLLPKATVNVNLIAFFTNSNGEVRQMSTSFMSIVAQKDYQIVLENGYMKVNCFEFNKPVAGTAILKKYINSTEITTQIKLPYSEPYNPVWENIVLSDENHLLLAVFRPKSEIRVNGEHLGDSVVTVFNNPHKIPINYWLFKGQYLLQSGQSAETRFLVKEKKTEETVYFLKYQYLWAGASEHNTLTLEYLKNRLHIEVETPIQVQPGEQAQIKIKVKDANDNPVKGVNLLAGAINAQFNQSNNFSDINITNKPFEPLKEIANFKQRELNQSPFKYPLTLKWYEPFALKEQFYYNIRSRNSGIFTHYDSITTDTSFKRIAQFAPYVFKNGLSQPVIMIYVNQKLSYYYETSEHDSKNLQPYSFVGNPGYNLIIIRTPEYEYVMDSVLLKAGHKLELAIHENYFLPTRNIQRIAKPNFLTAPEKQLLDKCILSLSNIEYSKDYYVWQDSNSIKHIRIEKKDKNQVSSVMVGPFFPSFDIYVLKSNYFGKSLYLNSNFAYKVENGNERLSSLTSYLQKQLPRHLQPPRTGQLLFKPSSIKYVEEDILPFQIFSLAYSNKIKTVKTRYQFDYQDDEGKYLKAIALINDNSIDVFFRPNERKINTLQQGNYTLILLNQDEEFYEKRIVLQADSLLYNAFININWQKDTTGEMHKKFYFVPQSNDKEQLQGQSDIPFRGIPTTIFGKVTDSKGEPLIGASVFIRGASLGTVTDVDGFYSLLIPGNILSPVIMVSYTGFATLESTVLGNNQDFILEESHLLDEVVVTSYGISRSKKEVITTSVPLGTLQGRVAGVSISSATNSTETVNLSQPPNASIETESSNVLSSAASIRSNFKDYAYWKPNLRSDSKGEAYFSVTYPDNITSWNTYVVGMDKKKRAGIHYGNTKAFKSVMAQLSVPQFLVQGDTTYIVGKTINYTNDTIRLETNFEINGTLFSGKAFDLINGAVERFTLSAETKIDTMFVTYKMQMGKMVDGEQRTIPVFKNGIEQSKGIFVVLNKDTTFNILPMLPESEIKLKIEGNLLQTLVADLEYLKKYPYGCNEQTASRLLAFLMSKQIAKQLNHPFEEEQFILPLIQKLEKNQDDDGTWGWWADNSSDDWMTIYVTKVLLIANENNYKSKSLEKATQYIALEFDRLPKKLKVDALEVLAKARVPFNFETPLALLDTTALDLSDKLSLLKIKQILQRSYTLDTLYKYQQKTLFGGIYWKEKSDSDYTTTLKNTLLAYQILRQADRTALLPAVLQYFFEARNEGTGRGWMNTYLTAEILQLVLPDLLVSTPAELLMEEKCKVNNQTITHFPYQATFNKETSIEIEKTSKLPLFLTAYQQEFVSNPAVKSDIFKINSSLLQNDQPVTKLAAQQTATLRVEVETSVYSDYVMIEIPIPAGCSYFSKPNSWNHPEVHREYFKNKVAIFCRQLPVGKHTFEVELETRYAGTYTLLPAKVEQMYFPVLYGNNEAKRLRIEE